MKIIDNYINLLYKEDDSIEVIELKEEIREHLILSANEFINQGYNEEDAYNKSIEQFDDGGEMLKELYSALKENTKQLKESNELLHTNKLKFIQTFKYMFIFSLIATIISFCMYKYEDGIVLKRNLNDVKKLVTEIASTKDITKPETYKSELDKMLLDEQFEELIHLKIYSGVNKNTLIIKDDGEYFDDTGLELQYEFKRNISRDAWVHGGVSENKLGDMVWYDAYLVYNADKWFSLGLVLGFISICTFIILQYNRYILLYKSKNSR